MMRELSAGSVSTGGDNADGFSFSRGPATRSPGGRLPTNQTQ
jgi:hypothetical protein